MPNPEQTTLHSGDWQTEGKIHAGFVAIPELSGMTLLFIRFVAPEGWVCMDGGPWVRDPSDPSCRSCMGTFAIGAHVEGLQPLPDSYFYDKSSNPHSHIPEVFNGTPEINITLGELAWQYRDWYFEAFGKWIRLSINDLSLPYGGIYDYLGTWECPHQLHRLGRSADVNRTPDTIKKELDLIAVKNHLIEEHRRPGDENIHYELQ